jgi:hypothetical protein
MNFKQYLQLSEQNVPGAFDGPYNGGGFVNALTSATAKLNTGPAEQQLSKIDGWNMQIPQMTKKGYIEIFRQDKPNIHGLQSPVYIQLSDGTKMWMTTHELRRIKGSQPALGRYMVVTMQRHDEDKTGQQSKIEDVVCY